MASVKHYVILFICLVTLASAQQNPACKRCQSSGLCAKTSDAKAYCVKNYGQRWAPSGKTTGCIPENAEVGKPAPPPPPGTAGIECCNYDLDCRMTKCKMAPLGQSRCDEEMGSWWKYETSAMICLSILILDR